VPLIKSGSRAAVSQNISEMVKSGHPRDQAIAAALATARKYGGSGGVGLRRAAAAMTPPKMMKRGGKVVLDKALRDAKKYASGGKLDQRGLALQLL
jgi:hypothetical protein